MQNLEFELHPSRFYCATLSLVLIASALVIFILPLAMIWRMLLLAILLVYGGVIFWQFALLRAEWSVQKLRSQPERRWQIITSTANYAATLRGDSTVTSLVSVLRFDISERKRPVVCMVFRDSLPAEQYRQLVAVTRMS